MATPAAAVIGVPVSELPAATAPLAGTEIVPIVQDGQTRRATATQIAGAATVDVTITGEDGVEVTEPTPNSFTIGLDRLEGNLGFLNVPLLEAAMRDINENDGGKGIVQAAASTVTLSIVPDSSDDLGLGFVTTVIVADAGGTIVVEADPGVTLICFNDQTTADAYQLVGYGIATLLHLGTDLWSIHGSNVEEAP